MAVSLGCAATAPPPSEPIRHEAVSLPPLTKGAVCSEAERAAFRPVPDSFFRNAKTRELVASDATGPQRIKQTKVIKMVELGTRVEGTLASEVVKRQVRGAFPILRRCYEAAAKRVGSPSIHGVVASDWLIGADGMVIRADAHTPATTVVDDEMVSCIEHQLACVAFPRSEGETRVRYPIDFQIGEPREYVVAQVVGTEIRTAGIIEFAAADPSIDAISKYALDALADFLLNEAKDVEFLEVSAHTDEAPDDAANRDLSQRRAAAVVAELAKRGVALSRLRAVGYGSFCPAVPPSKPWAKNHNRRVDLTILKMGGKPTGASAGCALAAAKGIQPTPPP